MVRAVHGTCFRLVLVVGDAGLARRGCVDGGHLSLPLTRGDFVNTLASFVRGTSGVSMSSERQSRAAF
jgi:hypothetical protein